MKKKTIPALAVAIAASLFVASCEENISDVWSKYKITAVPHYLGVSESTFYFDDAAGGTKSITINAPNTAWEIVDLPDWLTIDKKSGTGNASLNVRCDENPSPTDARAALFTVRSTETDWTYSVSVSTTQVRNKKNATPEVTTVTFDGKAGSQSVAVTSNVTDWSVSVSAVSAEEPASWLTAAKSADGSSVALAATANPNNVARRAYVTVKTDDEEQQITVTQRAGNITATLDKLTYTYEAGTQTVTVTADAPWTAQTASSWIEIQPSSAGAGTTDVTVRTLANHSFDERSGYVYFVMADDNKVELPIEQGAVTFSLSESSLEFPHIASSKTITINTNAEWEFSSDLPDWLTVSAKEGKGTTDLSVSVMEYIAESVSPRRAILSFRPKVINRHFDVVISQTGQELNMNVTTLQFTNKSGSQSIAIDATGAWSASTSADWITVSPSAGEVGKATCLVSVEENTGEERVGEVLFHFYEETYIVSIAQQGTFLTLSTDGLQFGSTGGKLRVDISSNMRWNATVDDDATWLDVNPKVGEENDSLTITADDNPSVESRNGEVLVTPNDRQPLLVSVAQAARYLNISTSNIEFTATGGTSELITIDSDGDIEVMTETDWITINKVSEKSFNLKVLPNESYGSRNGQVVVSVANLLSGEIKRTIAVWQDGTKDNNGHELVDLGLPSGLLWATCNVGAHSLIEYGDYYAWGETETKSDYSEETYKWLVIVTTTTIDDYGFKTTTTTRAYTKYWPEGVNITDYSGTADGKTVLDPEDDAAHVNWGGSWRMPTNEEWRELTNANNCTWKWATNNDMSGYMVTSKVNDNSIFLPAGSPSYNPEGDYWSSSLTESYPYLAKYVWFNSGYIFDSHNTDRFKGLWVRPVCRP